MNRHMNQLINSIEHARKDLLMRRLELPGQRRDASWAIVAAAFMFCAFFLAVAGLIN